MRGIVIFRTFVAEIITLKNKYLTYEKEISPMHDLPADGYRHGNGYCEHHPQTDEDD